MWRASSRQTRTFAPIPFRFELELASTDVTPPQLPSLGARIRYVRLSSQLALDTRDRAGDPRKMSPGDAVRVYRENRKLTQAKLGEKLGGLSRQYVSDIERGSRSISKNLAKKLSALFDVPLERFL